MNPKTQSPKSLNLSQEELDKVAKARERAEAKEVKVNQEWYALAEFGYYFGWDGIQAVRKNEISIDEMIMLTTGARKVWANQALDMAHAQFLSVISSQSKKPGQVFKKGMRSFVTAARIYE